MRIIKLNHGDYVYDSIESMLYYGENIVVKYHSRGVYQALYWSESICIMQVTNIEGDGVGGNWEAFKKDRWSHYYKNGGASGGCYEDYKG